MIIDALLDKYGKTIKVLSLDCFDTLLWRKVAEPTDVFYDLQHYPTFSSEGITYKQRELAELIARKYSYYQLGNSEVTLQKIFQLGFPSLSEEKVNLLMREEIAAESKICYPFIPIIQLMRKAIQLNIKIIIVSSTYLEEYQLRELLMNTLPQDAYEAISQVFCSCDYQTSKHDGLFSKVIANLNVLPQEILHVGDNPIADLAAPKACGITAVYLTPLPYKIKHLLWLESVAALQVMPEIRHTCSLASPFKAIFANVNIDVNKPEQLLGYVSLGPIIYAFARFIIDKISALQQAGKKTKVAFLMRDGYLPGLAAEILDPNLKATRIYISRFTANAAALRSKADIVRYIIENFTAWTLEAHCQQLLLPSDKIEEALESIRNAKNADFAFTQFALQDEISNIIIENSQQYFKRLERYLQNELNLEENDTLVLVDIGYRGTIQRILTPVLQDTIPGLQVVGYYFQLEDFPEWQLSCQGLFDSAVTDRRSCEVVSLNFMLIEEFFSDGGDSVVDYTADGKPIYIKSTTSLEQAAKIKSIQAEGLRFVRDTQNYLQFLKMDIPMSMLRQTAFAELFRMICFLTNDEINFIFDFKHEVNKGTTKKINIFLDNDNYSQSLRRHSTWFLNHSTYTLRKTGDLEHTLAWISKKRLIKFFPNNTDISTREENLPVYLTYSDKKEEFLLPAKPTFDGYFSLDVVLSQPGVVKVEMMLGNRFQWIQLEGVEAMNHEHAYHESEADFCQDITSAMQLNLLEKMDGNLFQCRSSLASITIQIQIHDKTLVRAIFRPILAWK